MATSRAQRIGIWIITIVMAIGAVGVYFIAIIANSNDTAKQNNQQQILADYQRKVAEQAKQLSDKYYGTFSPYASQVASFEKQPAQEKLASVDLKEGDGPAVGDDTKFAAYYIGWNPDGKVFDQSIDTTKNSLKAPLSVASGLKKNASLISGWKEGMKGMKIGGVRQLTIPSSLAYAEQGQGSLIPPDTPLKFIVMAIPAPEEIPIPQELLSAY